MKTRFKPNPIKHAKAKEEDMAQRLETLRKKASGARKILRTYLKDRRKYKSGLARKCLAICFVLDLALIFFGCCWHIRGRSVKLPVLSVLPRVFRF